MWVNYNANPNNAHVGDCTVRAISEATGKTWERTFAELCVVSFDLKDMPEANRSWGEYLRRCGYKRKIIESNCTVQEFCAEHKNGTFVVAAEGHVICARNGDFIDTWDSSQEIALFYWEVI